MDFVQGLDTAKLVLFGTTLSFLVAPFTVPAYNLPIFLFGSYAQENPEATASMQTFTGLVGGSILWDIVWMSRNDQNGFIRLLSIILLLAKIPTFLAFGVAVRQRGAQFGGLGIRGGDFSGPTVWSMPGGFTSAGRDGYQNLDEEAGLPAPASKPAPLAPQAPQSHSVNVHPPTHSAHPPTKAPPPPTAPYQAV